MAEWLRRGLQILPSQFDSGRGLQKKSDRELSSKFSYFSIQVQNRMIDFDFSKFKIHQIFIRVVVESFVKLNYICLSTYSSVAQLVEQLTVNQLVAGSSPARGANLY